MRKAVVSALADNEADLPFALTLCPRQSSSVGASAATTGVSGVDGLIASGGGNFFVSAFAVTGHSTPCSAAALRAGVDGEAGGVEAPGRCCRKHSPPTRALLIPISLDRRGAMPSDVLVAELRSASPGAQAIP